MQAIIKNSNGSVESVSIILKDYYYYDGVISFMYTTAIARTNKDVD
jgi:hypothetical protein